MSPPPFCTGYHRQPFTSLVADAPGAERYPLSDFRVEWGPIFHRGRLDGTARVLVLGQDPGQHEAIARRILVGTAGQRVQGLLGKLGLTSEYVCLNAFLYSVYGQHAANEFRENADIAEYRNRWIDAVMAPGRIHAIIGFGASAKVAFQLWQQHSGKLVAFEPMLHPTFPDAASAAPGADKTEAELMEQMLGEWNTALERLHPLVAPAGHTFVPFGTAFAPEDLPSIPAFDFPAGTPHWMREPKQWARRTGEDANAKRRTITVTVPRTVELPLVD